MGQFDSRFANHGSRNQIFNHKRRGNVSATFVLDVRKHGARSRSKAPACALAAFISDLCSACTTLVQVGISRIMTATLVSPTTESRYEKTRPCACLAPRTSTGTRYCTMQCPASTALQGLLYAPSIYRSTSGKSYSISCALFHFLSPIVLHRPDSPQTL
jgi:hypothetical protein